MPTIDELREKITAACETAIFKGKKLKTEDWMCCPLGFATDNDSHHPSQIDIGRAMGVSVWWVDAFTTAFDGKICRKRDCPCRNEVDAAKLGREFRVRYIKAK